jgi:hypothetical protein
LIDRANGRPGIWAVLWSSGDDPHLLECRHFVGEGPLQVWLVDIATRYGRSNIAVDWTTSLRSDDRLAAAVRECVEAR